MARYSLFGEVEAPKEGQSPAMGTYQVTEIRLSDRRDGEGRTEIKVADGDVVALELTDGFRLWIRGDAMEQELAERARDGGLTLKPALGPESDDRGLGGWVLSALKVFRIDPVEGLVGVTAKAIEPQAGDQILGLDPTAPRPGIKDAWRPVEGVIPWQEGDPPVLLFIHGTFSSTLGSFGALFKAPGPAALLQAGYGGRIYGFEHRTLTASPIANALSLVDRLPTGASIHLVSHSRGGLVGDLLCLTPLIDRQGLLSPEYLGHLPPDDQRDLPLLVQRLGEKRPRVERFVRVASPSRGTTLASGRLDRWLSVVFNLMAKVPALGGPVLETLTDFILAVIKEPKDAQALPGLAAMMPDSPLVALLNRPDLQIPEGQELAVISGDIEPEGVWRRLKLLLPDLFFAGDHDLVVNTGSMYGGLRRAQGWFCLDQGADVNHFNYFGSGNGAGADPSRQPITVDALLLGLRGTLPGRLYRPLVEAPVISPARGAGGISGRRPVVFVLPGIMGSSLAVRDPSEEVWLSIRRLALGQLERLRMDAPLPIKPTGLLGLAYGDLLDYLDRSHDVLPFPYDWRRSVRDAAGLLADEVGRALDRAEAGGQPVCLLAHSMGGLVARALITERPDLWQRIRASGGRLVMLGTPNRGSWEIVRLLVAQAGTLKQLALLDVTKDRGALLAIIRDFQGALELLPEDRRDFFAEPTWRDLRAVDEAEDWGLPGQGRASPGASTWLEQARKARDWLRGRAIDPEGMVYVAGQAAETASELVETTDRRWPLPARRRLRFFVSQRGDGSVLWDSGLLPGVPTWYAPGVIHGDLAKDRSLFGAIEDLLVRGRTESRALRREEPVSRGADERREMPDREPGYYPDSDTLVRTALAISPPRPRGGTGPRVQVRVTHGSLAYARHRIAVGHYAGDTIVGAEAYLDRVLGGRLSARRALGLYPGSIGTQALFDHPAGGKPPGALVLGLGRVGELTPSLLCATFTRALLELARQVVEGQGLDRQGAARGPEGIALSCLLIGTGAGGIGVQESVLALLHGVVQANRTLEQAGQAGRVRVSAMELVELWEDRAIAAARTLDRIDQNPELAGRFEAERLVRAGSGGYRGGRGPDEEQGWWHRLQVRGDEHGALRFTQLTQRARAEETLSPTQTELVDRFVARACASTSNGPELNRTLFEMLLPNALKDGSELRRDLVLVLDKEAARFPWEMLEDRWSQPLPGQAPSSRGERGEGRRPGSVEFGMLRQLVTSNPRPQPVMVLERRALVIGDPKSDFVPLPGARDESRRVAGQLGQSGFEVTALIEPRDDEVMIALHGEAYQILHLAGHGVHRHRLASSLRAPCGACGQALPEREQDLVSGMIIGEAMVLTPADVEKMRRVPELVFLNCCHLARVDGKDSDRHQAFRLAANLAVQFIEMGVRAVVAAGWAVNDLAALTFAETFYRLMTAGRRLGESVRLAREQTWLQFPAINTWGAYQCYGDPDFSLGEPGSRVQRGSAERYVCPAQAVADLDNLRADALTASPAGMAALGQRLERIERALSELAAGGGPDWRERGDLAEALGLAQGELGRFDDAVVNLDRAIGAEDAQARWEAIEQRARYQARQAKALWARGDAKARETALALFEGAIAALETLRRVPGGRLTVERYRSLTGIHGRRVQCLATGERAGELERLVSIFEQAAMDLDLGQGDPLDPNSRLLWLSGKLMLTAYGRERLEDICPAFADWCIEIGRRTPGYEQEQPGALADAIRIEVRMLQALARGELTQSYAEGVAAALLAVLDRGASQRQLASLLDYLEFLQTLSEGATHKRASFRPQAAPLAHIAEALRTWQAGIQ